VFQAADIASDRFVMVRSPQADTKETVSLHVSHELTYIGRLWTANEVQHGMAADIRAHRRAKQIYALCATECTFE